MLPRLTTILIIVVGLVTLSLYFSRPKLYRQEFKAYFKNGQQLQTGAEVRVAGVRSGIVKSVKVRPEYRDAPVEVVFEVQTDYELPIPQDSFVLLGSAGVLGPTFLDVNVSRASGPPAQSQATLRTLEPELAESVQRALGVGGHKGDGLEHSSTQNQAVPNTPKSQ